MKTLADFKNRVKIGTKIHTTYHAATKGRDENGVLMLCDEDRGEREVSMRQSNCFALKTTRTDGKVIDSWCYFPKASECIFIDENTVQILDDDFRMPANSGAPKIPILTYKFL